MKKRKNVVLFSGFFPFYGFITGDLRNFFWMIPLNIAIMASVIFAVLSFSKMPESGRKTGSVLWRASVTSVLADAAGFFVRFLPLLAEMLCRLLGFNAAAQWLGKYVSDFTWYQIWSLSWNHIGLPWTIASILAAGAFVFLFNYHVMLKKIIPEKKKRLALCIALTLVCTPYSWTNPAW